MACLRSLYLQMTTFHLDRYGSCGPFALFSEHTSHRRTQIASTILLFEGENAGGPALTNDLKTRTSVTLVLAC